MIICERLPRDINLFCLRFLFPLPSLWCFPFHNSLGRAVLPLCVSPTTKEQKETHSINHLHSTVSIYSTKYFDFLPLQFFSTYMKQLKEVIVGDGYFCATNYRILSPFGIVQRLVEMAVAQ
jgi:hypothetical protein